MKTARALFALAFLVLLAGAVSASGIGVYGKWSDNSQILTINNGASAHAFIYIDSDSPPITRASAGLYDSSGRLVSSVWSDSDINERDFDGRVGISSRMYGGKAGTYTLKIRASDGLPSNGEWDLTLKVLPSSDNQNPVVRITYPVDGETYDEDITTIRYEASDNSGRPTACWFSRSNGQWVTRTTPCRGIWTIGDGGAREGTNTWTVYARDASGNVGSASVTFTVDRDDVEEIPMRVTGKWVDRTSSWVVTTGESVTFSTRYDSSFSPYRVNVALHDSEGTVLRTYRSETYTGRVTVHDGPFGIAPSHYNSEEGNYTIKITGTDADGNTDSHTLYLRVEGERDVTPPSVRISHPVEGETYNSPVTHVSYDVSDDSGRTAHCIFNDGSSNSSLAHCSGRFSNVASREGTNTWTVYATDRSGNVNSSTVTFNVNSTRPGPSSPLSITGKWHDRTQSLTVNNGESAVFSVRYESVHPPIKPLIGLYRVSSGGSQLVHAVDSGRTVDRNVYEAIYGISPRMYGQMNGTYEVRLKGSDGENNTNVHTLRLIVLNQTDDEPPVITFNSPLDGRNYTEHFDSIRYTVSDNSGTRFLMCWHSTDGGASTSPRESCSGTFTGVHSRNGTNTWTVYAQDPSGNIGSTTITFAVNGILPPGPRPEPEDDDDDDDDGGSRKNNYVYLDTMSDEDWMEQFRSRAVVEESEDDGEPERKLSFWERIWDAIIKFFRWLLGLN